MQLAKKTTQSGSTSCLLRITEIMVAYFMQTNFMDVSLQAMAPKKLLTKRARKDTAGEGSSAAPQAEIEFDGLHF